MGLFTKRTPNEIADWKVNPDTGKSYPVDKDGKTVPEKYLFGVIPVYRNHFEDDGSFRGKWGAYLYIAPFAIVAGLVSYCQSLPQ